MVAIQYLQGEVFYQGASDSVYCYSVVKLIFICQFRIRLEIRDQLQSQRHLRKLLQWGMLYFQKMGHNRTFYRSSGILSTHNTMMLSIRRRRASWDRNHQQSKKTLKQFYIEIPVNFSLDKSHLCLYTRNQMATYCMYNKCNSKGYSIEKTHSSYNNNRSNNSKRSYTLILSCLPLYLCCLICNLSIYHNSGGTRRYICCRSSLWHCSTNMFTFKQDNSSQSSQHNNKYQLHYTELTFPLDMEEGNNMTLLDNGNLCSHKVSSV